jgi:hypothetical protein
MDKVTPMILIAGFIFTLFLLISPNTAIAQRETIGRWILADDPVLKGSTVEIYKEGGNFYSYWKYYDGSTSTDKLTRKGKATFYKIGSVSGDHYVINRNSQLEIRDEIGLVTTARPLK